MNNISKAYVPSLKNPKNKSKKRSVSRGRKSRNGHKKNLSGMSGTTENAKSNIPSPKLIPDQKISGFLNAMP